MAELEIKDIVGKKIARFKEKIAIKELQLTVLLEITNAINSNQSTLEILEKYKAFVKERLNIEKLILFSKFAKWRCLLDYGLSENELDKFEVERDLLPIREITSVTSIQNDVFKTFDMVVPVYKGENPLAFLILGDVTEDALSISSIIKHLNFLQLLTNIVVTALENARLAKEVLKQEQERRRMIEKQNEILEGLVEKRTKELRLEKEESVRLLHNILPKEIADELMLKGTTTPKRFNEVSILFTDFKGFTSTSATISPQKLLKELNDIFMTFDHIMGKYGIEKIKTIGDAYMAVCGVPMENENHAIQIVRAAVEMQEFMRQRALSSEIKWEMRAGVHSGPLIAGVVGTKKFTYDVWGDTVNTASRMESNGQPGRINVSSRTFELVRNFFEMEHRGRLMAKGKGEIDMYFVNAEKHINPKLSALKEKVLSRLSAELPAYLYYHGVHHTLDVYNAIITIGMKEGVTPYELELLKTAALLHDIGFIDKYKDHEERSCEISRELLPEYGFTPEQIDAVCEIIMVTKLPQNPQTHLQRIICDADLDYLGRDDFWIIGNTLHRELQAVGNTMDDKQWNDMQVKFLSKHTYFTETARAFRQPVKQKHIEVVKRKVEVA